jgi:hypothetical protein
MARGKKTGGKNFEKGHPGMGGRPKLNPEVKELRQLDRADLEKCIRDALQLTEIQIKEKLDNPETQSKERLALRIILKGIGKGDQQVMDFCANFIFGEKPKKIEVDNRNPPTLIPQVVVLLPAKNPK